MRKGFGRKTLITGGDSGMVRAARTLCFVCAEVGQAHRYRKPFHGNENAGWRSVDKFNNYARLNHPCELFYIPVCQADASIRADLADEFWIRPSMNPIGGFCRHRNINREAMKMWDLSA